MNSSANSQQSAKPYITGVWGHLFDYDRGRERLTKIVIQVEPPKLVAAQVQRNRGMKTSYMTASPAELADIEDSIINANPDVFACPDDFALIYTESPVISI